MKKTINSFQNTLDTVQIGRAHPKMLENISLEYYGNMVPIAQVATITIINYQTLSISPWEKKNLVKIKKAILVKNIGLNPVISEDIVLVPIPPLSEDRRKEMIKFIYKEAEKFRISLRNIRRDTKNYIKELIRKKIFSDDVLYSSEKQIQDLTNKFLEEINNLIDIKKNILLKK